MSDDLVIRPWRDLEVQQRSLDAYLTLLMQMARKAPSIDAFNAVADRIERVLMAGGGLDTMWQAESPNMFCPAPECCQRFGSLLDLRRHVEDKHFAAREGGE